MFVALSLDDEDRPLFLNMQVTQNFKQASDKRFANAHIEKGSTIRSESFRSYPPTLSEEYVLNTQPNVHNSVPLHWLHTIISNANAFVIGTYHGLPRDNLQSYLDEFYFRFSRRQFNGRIFDRLVVAIANS